MAISDKCLRQGSVLHGKKNSYRIERVLGQGTFGITYLAYTTVTVEGDLGKLQTEIQVAVKEFFMSDINGREGSTVTTGGSSELFGKYRHKFAREASNLAKLKHRGIVKVIETFEANGTSYYAMEYCGGGSLDSRIKSRGSLPEAEALRYFVQIAEALQYMHSRRMLHLDLKPGNVMLRSSGEAVLIDFGLSKQFNDNGEPESSTTIGGGTPGYAPIEQANYKEDSGGKLPVAMDIYALGGTLYKMLTGERPLVASDVLMHFPEEPLRAHNVSDSTIAALRRAMQPKPTDRYSSVADFAAAIGSEATELQPNPESDQLPDPVPPQPNPNPVPQAEPKAQRRKWLPWVVGVVVAVVAFVAVMLLRPEQQQPIEAPDNLAEVVAQVADTLLSAADTLTVVEQPLQQVAPAQQQPQRPEPKPQQPAQQQPQRPTQQPEPEPVQQPQRQQSNLPEIEMVYVKGGTFTMGATPEQGNDALDDEKPAHKVTLDSYYIGKYEVTQKLWKAVMGNNPSAFKGENLPVTNVSWNDVQEFLSKLNKMTGKNYRLPMEAEWEYAARGGNRSVGYKYSGDGSHRIGNIAWYGGNSSNRTHEVGTMSPNELGIYDMSGNVLEWCQDWYGSYSSSSQRNPKGPNSGSYRVLRGGSWNSYTPEECRVSRRNYSLGYGNRYIGFRLALSL